METEADLRDILGFCMEEHLSIGYRSISSITMNLDYGFSELHSLSWRRS
jgi:hypothetical protein